MKRIIALTFILTAISCPCYAQPKYSEETLKLMREAGLAQDNSLETIMSRQEALQRDKANNSTPTTQTGLNGANRRVVVGGNDELHIEQSAVNNNKSVKVTDTSDGLHIYSNEYNTPSSYGAKYSTDEFRVFGQDTPANDGHDESTWGELHINERYRQNVYYEPEKDKNRLSIDEYRLPWMLN